MAVTGLGVVSCLGCEPASFWSSLAQGLDGMAPLNDFPGLRFKTGCRVRDFLPEQHFSARQLEQLDPITQYFVVAGRQASAGLVVRQPGRAGLVHGTGGGAQVGLGQSYLRVHRGERLGPGVIPKVMHNAPVSFLAQELGWCGPSYTLSTACASSNHALGQAFWMIRAGLLDVALAGGSEAPFSEGYLRAWEAIRAVAPDRCRPFSKNRSGMTLAEGAGVLLLENFDHARARGATVYAEMLGFGMSSDAHDLTRPLQSGAVQAMSAALQDAGLQPQQIDYINAHGTGTLANDSTETAAIRQVFGGHAERLLVSSTKSSHGHALGAAGGLEAVASVLALRHQLAPATLGYQEPDPECDLDYVVNQPRPAELTRAMSNSFAFGGLNAVVIFSREPACE
ncbi:MAG: beta-ketoacyl-[acyl-carrier-protein] synthase family protein [Vulcanimicrobiota bacterium]